MTCYRTAYTHFCKYAKDFRSINFYGAYHIVLKAKVLPIFPDTQSLGTKPPKAQMHPTAFRR